MAVALSSRNMALVLLRQSLTLFLLTGCHGNRQRKSQHGYHEGNSEGGTVHVVEDSLIKPAVRDKVPLKCHLCYMSIHKENCTSQFSVNLGSVETETCTLDQEFCQVEKYIRDGNLTTFTRGCSQKCTPGCVSAGVYYKVEYCYSCCKYNFCNVGNAAQRHSSGSAAISLSIIMFYIINFLASS